MPKRRIVNIRTSLPVKEGDCLEKAAAFIGSNLEKLGIRKKFARKTELLSEETIAMFLEHAQENAVLKIRIKRFFGDDLKMLERDVLERKAIDWACDQTR